MIRLLSGTVYDLWSEGIILDVQGVGYEVHITRTRLLTLQVGQKVSMRIYTHWTDSGPSLFGLETAEERHLLELLISVSGVGPKTGLSVLDKGVDSIIQAIRESDVAFFQGIPRLGKKTAQKIILELQSKLGSTVALDLAPESTLRADLRAALTNMGYAPELVSKVLSQLDASLTPQQALKWSLQQMSRAA